MRAALAVVGCLVLAGCGQAVQLPTCVAGADVICDIVKPEDIEAIPNSRWLLVSELGNGADKPGRIVLVDPDTKEKRTLIEGPQQVAEGAAEQTCGAPPEKLTPRGFHLSTRDDGSLRLLVISGTRVERFHIKVDGDEFTSAWINCVSIAPEISANDVAALDDDGIVVSHMFAPPRTAMMDWKFMLGMNTGAVYAWRKDGGWTRIPNSDVSFGNGIQVDPKTGRIYVASMYAQRIVALDKDGANRQETPRLPIQNDNISWSSDGKLIGVGHSGFPVRGTARCRELGGAPCGFPFTVVQIDPKTLAFETLFENKVPTIPGASVALRRGNALYLGTAFGDRITKVTVQAK